MTEPGGVVVPAHLAGELPRLVLIGIRERVRAGGATLSPACHELLVRQHRANVAGSDSGTTVADAVSLDSAGVFAVSEAARALECSTGFVRRLARRGVISGRRLGHAWALDAGSVEEYRRGRRSATEAEEHRRAG
jgi:excisionase family DNA binding protein